MSRVEKFINLVEVLEDGTILDKEGKELKQYLGKSGYYYIMLPGLGFIPVHQLVAFKYLEKRDSIPMVLQ